MAQVSRGTVDRVLHNRGKISEEAQEKVIRVLKEIRYRPNIIARSLKTNRSLRVVTLIPNYTDDAYWFQCVTGIQKAREEYAPLGLEISSHYYDPHDKEDFVNQANEILGQSPDGILFAPIFYNESIKIVKKCNRLGIPCTTINTLIEGPVSRTFVGQDLYQSGRVAAHLFRNLLKSGGDILITNIDEEVKNSRHVQDKERGFRSFFENQKGQRPAIYSLQISRDELDNLSRIVTDYYWSKPTLSGIFVTTSKTYLVAEIIKENNLPLHLIGYDLIDENLHYLESGEIDFLINQNPREQGYQAISSLGENLIFNKTLPEMDMLPIDIVSAENVRYYLHKA